MDSYTKLRNYMKQGKCILIDGATATELERQGVPQIPNAWNGGGALSHPHVLKDIHRKYIRAGSRIIISNTFATCKHTLEDAAQSHNFKTLNAIGVSLAVEARSEEKKSNVLVAAGLSYWSFTNRHPGLIELRKNLMKQVEVMKNAGADLLMLEMMVDIDRMLVTIESAGTTNLPIWVGLSCKPDVAGRMCLLNGEPLTLALKRLQAYDIDLVSIMHTDVTHVDACLDILDGEWNGLCGVYAHSGKMVGSKWTFNDVITPAAYSKCVERWIERKVNLVGGCCGITIDHVLHISKKFFSPFKHT